MAAPHDGEVPEERIFDKAERPELADELARLQQRATEVASALEAAEAASDG